jgi:hypothetical protein
VPQTVNAARSQHRADLEEERGVQNLEKLRDQTPLPIDEVLQLLAFEQTRFGNFERKWGRLTVSCGIWFYGWHFMCDWFDGRTIGCPEFRVAEKIAPVSLLAVLYRMCGDAFTAGELPPEFELGKQENAEQRRARLLIPQVPTVWADREFLRFCLAYLERADDWSGADYTIGLSIADEQLMIKSKSRTVHCPAKGAWRGSSEVSARHFYRRVPKRFSGHVVKLGQRDDGLLIDSHILPAKWF